MSASKLCLIDANSLFYRAFYAIKTQLANSQGQPTNAVFGFVRMVKKILEDLDPAYVAVCFDVGRVTHRTEKFAHYKIHRAPMPDTLVSQVPFIKDVVRAYHFTLCEAKGFEADDVIASLVARFSSQVDKIVIVSSDKDILQLVSPGVQVYNPYKGDGRVFTPEGVREHMGVEPGRIADLIALMGDASDNIPGARGIGEKTALGLLRDFKDIDDLIRHKDRLKREVLQKIVAEHEEDIRLSKELATLRFDVPLDVKLEDLAVKSPDYDELWDIFSKLEFRGFLKEISGERMSQPGRAAAAQTVACSSEELPGDFREGAFAIAVNEADPAGGTLSVNVCRDEKTVFCVSRVDVLARLFGEPGRVCVCFDAKSLKHTLKSFAIEPRVTFFDTMIAGHLLESSRGARELENLLWDYLDCKTVSRLEYLGRESHYLIRLHGVLGSALKDKALVSLFQDVEMPLVDVLFEMESTGIKIDRGFLKDLSIELEKKLSGLIARIFDLAGSEFNVNSPKQLSEVLFHQLKLPVVKKTKTGFSTDEEVLSKLSADYELPRVLLEYRQVSKLKTTYVDALPELICPETGRIHSTFNQTVTETGRLSSNSPNLQNIPVKTELGRRIRRAFVPSDEYDALLSADYSQVELRILAHVSEDPALIEAFEKNADIHAFTASLIFGVTQDDVTDEMRENAKRVNFGIVYGMSSYGLAKDLEINPRVAETFIAEYFLRYPRVKAYLDGQVAFVREHGYVTTILGRRRYIPEIHNQNAALRQFAERQAINAPIQGSAADLIKMAMVDLANHLKKKSFRSRLLLQVHDELVLEILDEEKKELVAQVRRSMENILKLKVPLKVSLKIGKNWLETDEVG